MKLFVQLILLIYTISAQTQDFKPFKVKSGKIIYEKWNYSTVSRFSSVNGVESAYSKHVPYTAEQVNYYWDEFGDVAFEEVFQVSEFGGKPLPEKVKIFERLWIDDHRYYFDVEENKISDDPYYLRIKCREIFQYYQIIGSWIKTQYMGVEASGKKEISGEEADYYKIDDSTDLYAWKELVLKQDEFYTNRAGNERRGIYKTKIAVEIDTTSKINDSLFNPVWLKREKSYQSFDRNKLDEFLDARQELLEQADNVEGINIEKNDILFFVTTNHRLGKMQILSCNENAITIKYKWYYNDNSVGSNSDSFLINKNTFIDIDAVTTDVEKTSEVDFRIGNTKPTILFPQNNIGIYRLKASRTNTF